MKKFLFKSLMFSFIIVSTVALLSFTYKKIFDVNSDYMASIIDKHKRLDQFDNNRLLLIGGSNLAFGIDSGLIEEEFNVNVINLGLHAGLGLKFIINEAMSSVKKGDIVLLSLEYPLYDESSQPSIDLINHTQTIYPNSKSFYDISLKDNFFISLQNSKKWFDRQNIQIDSVYNRKYFNKYGDVVGHLTKAQPKDIDDRGVMNKINIDNNVSLLHELYLKCNSLDAKLYIVFPNYPISEFNKNKTVIYDLKEQIKTKVDFIEMINEPETFVFEDSFFFDTVFHLNAKGRQKRTKMLIKILRSKVFNYHREL